MRKRNNSQEEENRELNRAILAMKTISKYCGKKKKCEDCNFGMSGNPHNPCLFQTSLPSDWFELYFGYLENINAGGK